MIKEEIRDKRVIEGLDMIDDLLAVVAYDVAAEGDSSQFITREESAMQSGVLHYRTGDRVNPHYHRPVGREIVGTAETLMVFRGVIVVTFYGRDRRAVRERTLRAGDVVTLLAGGHSLEAKSDATVVEVKQGPYVGRGADKVEFRPKEN